MKSLKLILAVVCVASAVGCGLAKDNNKVASNYSGIAGSCIDAKTGICTHFSYSVTADADPKAQLVSDLKAGCASPSQWSEGKTCDATNSRGKCTISKKQDTVEINATMFFESTEIAALACKSSGGSFSAKME